ncbi:MAG: helix-turn-helix domain-containing protein [Mobilitalea sp.]
MEEKGLLNVSEVCFYLGVGQNTARNLLNKPKNLFTVRIGNRLYANKKLLDKWLDIQSGQ